MRYLFINFLYVLRKDLYEFLLSCCLDDVIIRNLGKLVRHQRSFQYVASKLL